MKVSEFHSDRCTNQKIIDKVAKRYLKMQIIGVILAIISALVLAFAPIDFKQAIILTIICLPISIYLIRR